MKINMDRLLLLLFIVYATTFYGGKLLQKVRIPWIFAALLLGTVFSLQGNWFNDIFQSGSFQLLSEFGILFLLFIIGFSINLKEIRKQGLFILRSTMFIILGEAIVGTLLIHTFFDLGWLVSILVASSFATVGEAVLLPILDEFNLTKKRLGQTILSIGVLDDVIEIVVLIIVSLTISANFDSGLSTALGHALLALVLILSPWALKYFGFIKHSWQFAKKEHLFIGTMMVFMAFVWFGTLIDATELAALIAGIVVNNALPDGHIKMFESEIKLLAYGFFAPIFFVSVGIETNFDSFGSVLPLSLLLALGTSITKIVITYYSTHRHIGEHESIVAGIALTVRLSTSIVVIKILLDNNIIPSNLFTVLVSTTIIFKFINPPLIAYLIKKWGLSENKKTARVPSK